MSWLCLFLPCRWLHHGNVVERTDNPKIEYGLYQCTRCKTIRTGRTGFTVDN